jgi:hypothetical protein
LYEEVDAGEDLRVADAALQLLGEEEACGHGSFLKELGIQPGLSTALGEVEGLRRRGGVG